jgi:hypothetical protein
MKTIDIFIENLSGNIGYLDFDEENATRRIAILDYAECVRRVVFLNWESK